MDYECENCDDQYEIEELEWSEGDEAFECPKCGGCYFAIINIQIKEGGK